MSRACMTRVPSGPAPLLLLAALLADAPLLVLVPALADTALLFASMSARALLPSNIAPLTACVHASQ